MGLRLLRRSRAETGYVILIHLFVEFTHHHRLNGREQFGRGEPTDTECGCQSQPIMPPIGAAHICPPRRPTRSHTCQPSNVCGWFRICGQSSQVLPLASRGSQPSQYPSPPPNTHSARAARRFFPHPAPGPWRRIWSERPRTAARHRAGHRCPRE